MRHLFQILHQARSIARIEAGFFLRRTKLLVSVAAVAMIPSLYTVIYLSSLWDPVSHSNALKVGLVNLDQGLLYREQTINVGQELSNTLQATGRFDYQHIAEAEQAKTQVRQGRLAFALIIPENFSSNAVPGEQPGAGKLVVFASPGNNVETARIAQQFASELGHKVNESLNAQRWELVLVTSAGSRQSVSRLNQGLKELHHGAQELQTGAQKASSGAQALDIGAQRMSQDISEASQNMKKLGNGLRSLDAQRPRNSELRKLDEGTDTLVKGLSDLGSGLKKIQNSSAEISGNVLIFKEDVDSSLMASASTRNNVGQLSSSLQQLDAGLLKAAESEFKLEDGAKQLKANIHALTAGVRQMNTAVRSMSNQFPEDASFVALETGASELAQGTKALALGNEKITAATQRLEMGIDLITRALPDMGETPDGSPEGLADSVRPVFETVATVQNNGIGFIANVIPAALWLGAGIAVFFVNLSVLPRHATSYHPLAQMMGKLAFPGLLVAGQCGLVLLTIGLVLQVNVIHPWGLFCIVMTSGLAFLGLISAMSRFIGDAGKALAMVLLAVQLTSSGGVMPVELSGSFFATLSPWLPITWLAKGLKAALFGAFEGAWLLPCLQIACLGLVAALVTIRYGRWRFVSVRKLRPQLDL